MKLERHNTPLGLCALATPPQLRRRADLYRENMDPKISEDTAPLHWTLDQEQTTEFLAQLFPDDRLFPPSNATSGPTGGGVKSIVNHMQTIRQRSKDRWAYYPDSSNSPCSEEKIAQFFNGIIQHVPNSHLCTRRWTGKAANNPVDGLDGAVRKPDLLLCEEGVITKRDAANEKFDMRTDVYALGEVKKSYSEESKKESYVELAGKAAFLLEAQDGRYATPGIRLLGSSIILTLFDRGGSISTHPLDIHQFPEEFLRIILGITFADGTILGFDLTVSPADNNQKKIQIVKQGTEYAVLVDMLLFFSGSLHSRGMTVWSGKVIIDKGEEEVVVKDSWVDPLRQYTEGRILKLLENANVKGVPRLVHEQQVRTQHPVTRASLNHSTHILRSLIDGCPVSSYTLRVLSRLVSTPRGYPLFEFTSLSELLVGIIDCLRAHRDALKDAGILHRDISLFNLLFALVHGELDTDTDTDTNTNTDTDFLNRTLQEPERTQLRTKIQNLPRRGLLADWGYAVPITRASADEHASDAALISDTSSDQSTTDDPGVRVEGEENVIPRSKLGDGHSVIIPVVDEPSAHSPWSSIDADPLQRTGTWAWMAAELSHIGPGTPVEHRAHHDLESFFYILLAICLLYDEPGKLKPSKVLAICFDPFFSVTHPSTLKTITVQSRFGWTAHILPYISKYFQPVIPLLQRIREQLILPIELDGKTVSAGEQFTHDDFIDSIVDVLSKLPKTHWNPKGSTKCTNSVPRDVSTSSTSGTTTVLPNGPVARLPLIRIPNTSSGGSSTKCRFESDGDANDRMTKRRSPTDGSGDMPSACTADSGRLSTTSWTTLDLSDVSFSTSSNRFTSTPP